METEYILYARRWESDKKLVRRMVDAKMLFEPVFLKDDDVPYLRVIKQEIVGLEAIEKFLDEKEEEEKKSKNRS